MSVNKKTRVEASEGRRSEVEKRPEEREKKKDTERPKV